ncbi:ATP dependent RNA helicase DHX33 [Trichuris trichiura]|uniref:RNA helicase n=1 Tax=Trichuris trichiura TaxID=36087 RepID=A0A077ZC30_TRITR|nr:ATP dependent RNA helicase DHX33 [Trichuris trichiura]
MKKQKNMEKSKGANEKAANKGLTLEQRKQRDADIMRQKQQKKEGQNGSHFSLEFPRLIMDEATVPKLVNDQLPVRLYQEGLLRFIKSHDTVILIGETGCGKSTQVPQMLYECCLHCDMVIGITEPRRVAAISLAERVANEMKFCLGYEVGYSVRFDEVASDHTRIFYLTEGMLIREAMYGLLLERYSVIILDEVHERTLQTDVLFGVVKTAQKFRTHLHMPPLKVVIMSATMDVDHISSYFDNAPVVYCEGRTHPVHLFYLDLNSENYFFNCLVTVFQIHRTKPLDGDILVFLTGQDEIDVAVAKCKEVLRLTGVEDVLVLPFYATLSPYEQMKVFKIRSGVSRRIIVATNIAETSLTIPNVRYIVDSGKVKMRLYDPSKGVDMLRVVNASKAQVDQRAGRAGREMPGECYRVFTEEHYLSCHEFAEPEIKRCSLTTVLLQLLVMGVSDASKFDFIDRPSEEGIQAASMILCKLGAVTFAPEGHLQLTKLGKTMAAFPVDPKFSRAIIAGGSYQCSEEVITIVAMLSAGNVYTGSAASEAVQLQRRKFFCPEGDLIRMLQMYNAFSYVKESDAKTWCLTHFVNYRHLVMARKIRSQLRNNCQALKIPLLSCKGSYGSVCRALLYGFFMQAAVLDNGGQTYKVLSSGLQAKIHPSSCLHGHKPSCLLFNELTFTNQLYLRDVTVISQECLSELNGKVV